MYLLFTVLQNHIVSIILHDDHVSINLNSASYLLLMFMDLPTNCKSAQNKLPCYKICHKKVEDLTMILNKSTLR